MKYVPSLRSRFTEHFAFIMPWRTAPHPVSLFHRVKLSRRPSYRPQLLLLEERLPLGDGVLGLLVGSSLLATQAALPAAEELPPPSADGREVTRLAATAATSPLTFPACPDEVLINAYAVPNAVGAPARPPLTKRSSPAARSAARLGLFETAPTPLPSLPVEPVSVTPFAMPRASSFAGRDNEGNLLAMLVALQTPAVPTTTSVTPTQEAQIKENFGKLPLYFEQNVGQTDSSVHFFTRGPGYGLFLTSTEAVMVLQEQSTVSTPLSAGSERLPDLAPSVSEEPAPPPAVVRMQMVGGNPAPAVTGHEQLRGKINYFLGNDPAKWHTNVATFGRVEYDAVYPGIDLVYHSKQGQLEYDFVVSPGVDPNVIRLNISGAEQLELDANGDLVVHAGGQQLRQHKPFVYQEVNGTRQEVGSRFVLDGGQVWFDVAAYDVGRALVIDPELTFSTYLGGSGQDQGTDIALHPTTGDALITGRTDSVDFPTDDPFQPKYRGLTDAFVSRVSEYGEELVFSTYLGGSDRDLVHGIAVDPRSGDVLLTGRTKSADFPIDDPFQPNLAGIEDAFVTRLSEYGEELVFSTYFGGNTWDVSYDIAVEPMYGDILITGVTGSFRDFPTVNPLQPNFAGAADAFVARLNEYGGELVFSTYLGGSGWDEGDGIAVEAKYGDVFITGQTRSTNFPTANPFQPNPGGLTDVFVARLSEYGGELVFSTYLGGRDDDESHGIAVEPKYGDVLITGHTYSTNFPIVNALQPNHGGGYIDAFVARLYEYGGGLVFSTYLGGGSEDWSGGIAVDPTYSNVLIAGYTCSWNFPLANPLQSVPGGRCDAFVARLYEFGGSLAYSTYLGGSEFDAGLGIAVDPRYGAAFITGMTSSTDFPTANPLQPKFGGDSDAFVSRIDGF